MADSVNTGFDLDPSTFVFEAGAEILRRRQTIWRAARRLWLRLTGGGLRLTVFGAGGVGKSTLGAFLEEGGVMPGAYEESTHDETFELKDALASRVVVVPGQPKRIKRYWTDQYREMAKGEVHGLVNVVAYGYHDFQGIDYRDLKVYEEGMTPDDFLAAHLEDRRAREIELLETLKPHLVSADGEPWMITLVTKQDLWWGEQAEAKAFYTEGRYGEIIGEIEHERGALNFRHEYVPVALLRSNFAPGTGDVLKPTTGGYDDEILLAHQVHLLRLIDGLTQG